jgi:hypothetical protein
LRVQVLLISDKHILSAGGRSALALRLLLAGASSRISSSAGVPTGEEVSRYTRSGELISMHSFEVLAYT